jgi:hypothetical protein
MLDISEGALAQILCYQFEEGSMPLPAQQDKSVISVDGVPKQRLIDGVVIRHATTHPDKRDTLCEILNPAWDFHPAPFEERIGW